MCVTIKNTSKEKVDISELNSWSPHFWKGKNKEGGKKRVKNANCKAIKIPYKTISGTILESRPFPQPLKEVS